RPHGKNQASKTLYSLANHRVSCSQGFERRPDSCDPCVQAFSLDGEFSSCLLEASAKQLLHPIALRACARGAALRVKGHASMRSRRQVAPRGVGRKGSCYTARSFEASPVTNAPESVARRRRR